MLICIFVGCSMVKGMIIHEGFKVRWPNWLWIRSTDSWGLSAGCLSMFHGKKPMVSLRFLLLHWIYLRRCMFEHWVLWAECEVVWVSCQSVLPDWLTLSVAFNHTCSLYLRIGWTGEVTGNARIFRGKKKVLVILVIFPTKTHPMLVASGQEYSHVSEALYCAARGAFLTSTATESCHTMYGLVNVEVDMGVPQQLDVFLGNILLKWMISRGTVISGNMWPFRSSRSSRAVVGGLAFPSEDSRSKIFATDIFRNERNSNLIQYHGQDVSHQKIPPNGNWSGAMTINYSRFS